MTSASRPAYGILAAISLSHLINDAIQSLLPALYPAIKSAFALSFAQVGLLSLALLLTASLLQPLVGMYTDRRPVPHSLVLGMGVSLAGLLALAVASSFAALLAAAVLLGVGSSVFHPESSRVARMASGGRYGFAQSVFQVGGNAGSALGPLVAAFLVGPRGQPGVAWCALLILGAIAMLWRVDGWSGTWRSAGAAGGAPRLDRGHRLSRGRIAWSLAILAALVFSKYFYLASLNNYYMFFLISRFQVSLRTAQIYLFVFLAAVAAGTVVGGPVGDRFGRKRVIWGSILGVLPFSLLLPYVNLFWTGVLSVAVGLVLASAFSAILVYAQELVPGRVGLISGIFFGFAFGMGGLGAAALGRLADTVGIEPVYQLCAFLPLIGVLAAFLPDLERATLPDRSGVAHM